jgi:hypothetical protein
MATGALLLESLERWIVVRCDGEAHALLILTGTVAQDVERLVVARLPPGSTTPPGAVQNPIISSLARSKMRICEPRMA